MCYPDPVDRTADLAGILAAARERHAAGKSPRGLPRPAGLEPGGWWHASRHALADGTVATYLTWRWRDRNSVRSRAVGRLDVTP